MKRIAFLVLWISTTNFAAADYYQWTDKNGTAHLSDAGPTNSDDVHNLKIFKGPAQTYTPGSTPYYLTPSQSTQTATSETPYTRRTGEDPCTTSENAKSSNLYSGDEERQEKIWKKCHGMK